MTPSLELITESTLEVEVLNLERKSEYAAEGKSGISSHSQLGFLITYLKQSKKKKKHQVTLISKKEGIKQRSCNYLLPNKGNEVSVDACFLKLCPYIRTVENRSNAHISNSLALRFSLLSVGGFFLSFFLSSLSVSSVSHPGSGDVFDTKHASSFNTMSFLSGS